jgi:3-hydroxyisobutyrate dehydrogenase
VRVAVLGLGAMGRLVAANLLDAEHQVQVWNRSTAASEPLLALGATAAVTPAQAAADADAVLVMVTDDDASAEVWFGDDGALEALHAAALAVEMSTLTPGMARRIDARVRGRGGAFVDAPVLGSRPQAAARQLLVLAGGETDHIRRARALLEATAQEVRHVGPVGSGMATKLVVNAWFALQVAGLAEVTQLADDLELDATGTWELLAALPLTAPALVRIGDLIAERAFTPNFPIRLATKDLEYALRHRAAVDAGGSLIAAAHRRFDAAVRAGDGDLDIAGIGRAHVQR